MAVCNTEWVISLTKSCTYTIDELDEPPALELDPALMGPDEEDGGGGNDEELPPTVELELVPPDSTESMLITALTEVMAKTERL